MMYEENAFGVETQTPTKTFYQENCRTKRCTVLRSCLQSYGWGRQINGELKGPIGASHDPLNFIEREKEKLRVIL